MREVKTAEEVYLLKKAIEISAIGQREVMKAMRPNMTEREIQGIHEFVFKKYGAAYEGYPSIVGAGSNACVLHYIENDEAGLDSDLILMDLQMPVMDGFQAAINIRQNSGKNQTTPIVGLSANVSIGDKQAVLEAGMNAHLAKPIRVEVLKDSIAAHVKVTPSTIESVRPTLN